MTTTKTYALGELPARSIPEHLVWLEELDGLLLPVLSVRTPATAGALEVGCPYEHRSVFGQWLLSAEWRGLVCRVDDELRSSNPPRYVRFR